MPPCRHCEKTYANASRGLCKKCYNDPVIKAMYPPRRHPKCQPGALGREPTEEELNQMIAEQLPTMPKYDPVEDAKDRRIDRMRRMK